MFRGGRPGSAPTLFTLSRTFNRLETNGAVPRLPTHALRGLGDCSATSRLPAPHRTALLSSARIRQRNSHYGQPPRLENAHRAHEPERGVHAASATECQRTLKRHKCRAPKAVGERARHSMRAVGTDPAGHFEVWRPSGGAHGVARPTSRRKMSIGVRQPP